MTTAIRTIEDAIEAAPAGTSGLVIEPWAPGELYGVAADWGQARCPIRVLGEDGWTHDEHGRQVADFHHNDHAALRTVLADAMVASGANQEDADIETIGVTQDATEFAK